MIAGKVYLSLAIAMCEHDRLGGWLLELAPGVWLVTDNEEAASKLRADEGGEAYLETLAPGFDEANRP